MVIRAIINFVLGDGTRQTEKNKTVAKKTKKKTRKKRKKRVLEGYYIDDKGLKILYKDKDGGLSI